MIKPRIDLANRTKLETVIPLKTPYIVYVDPSSSCNFTCPFCFQSNKDKAKVGFVNKTMDMPLYMKIINDILQFPDKLKVLRLYMLGEPLLNFNFASMVKHARSTNCCERIDTTTNASLLNKKKSLDIIDAGLDRINISIEGVNSKQYKKFSKKSVDFEKLVDQIHFFYSVKRQCELIIKVNGDSLSDSDKQLFYDTFTPISDGCFIEHTMQCWSDTEIDNIDKSVGLYGQEVKEISVCPYPFYSLAINSDGKISLCFLDWNHKLIIGDVANDSIVDIWNGELLKTYQKLFLTNKRRDIHSCKDCGQMTHGLCDNIDDFSAILLNRIN